MLDNVPTKSPPAFGLSRSILISTNATATNATTILPIKTVLPISTSLPATLTQNKGYFQILAGPAENESSAAAPIALGEVVFNVENATAATPVIVLININIDIDSSLKIEVCNQSDGKELVTLDIPKP